MGITPERQIDGIFVLGFPGQEKPYPVWRYHEWLEPVLVHNEDDDKKVKAQGWFEHNKITTVPRYLLNQKFDLEDFSDRQLVEFAKAEFGVDLPVEVGKEKLFKAIWTLSMNAPENKDRIVLMAHAIQMNYEETQREILKLVTSGNAEITVEEFEA